MLDKKRRPKTYLSDDEKQIIEDAYNESFLGTRLLRYCIQKHYKRNISHNKIHQHLLVVELVRPNRKKQNKRKRCRYERKHSLSLVHADWLDYDGTQVIAYLDDTSRKILTADEFDSANIESGMRILGKAVKEVEFYVPIRALPSDNGSEFSSHWKHKKEGSTGIFQKHLEQYGIKHITTSVNHSQTNGKLEKWFELVRAEERRI